MIEVKIQSEFGEYTQRLNHGHKVNWDYTCTDAYQPTADNQEWSKCPCCNLTPRIWTFNNGRGTACGCGNSIYDHFSVYAESIMSVVTRCGGSAVEYDCDELRKNWNEYCATMVSPCSHADLRLLDRW